MLNIKFAQSVITAQQPLDCSLGVNLYLSFSGLVPGNSYVLNMESISVDGSVVFDPSSYMFVAASNDVSSFSVKATCQYARYFIIKSSLLEMSSDTVVEDTVTIDCLSIPPVISATPTQTPTNTATPSQTATSTPTPSNTSTVTPTPSITESRTPTPTVSDSQTPTPTVSDSQTPTPTISNSQTPTPTISNSQTPTPTISNSQTPTPTISNSQTPTPSVTNSQTPTVTETSTPTQTPTKTPTQTPTNTVTTTETPTQTSTPTTTPTTTPTHSLTPTHTTTKTPSNSPTQTPTPSETPTNTPTISDTPTNTPTMTPSNDNLNVCIGTDQPTYYVECCYDNKQISPHYKFNIVFVNLIVGAHYFYEILGTDNIKIFTTEDNFIARDYQFFTSAYMSLRTDFCEYNYITIKIYEYDTRNILRTRAVKVDCKSISKQNLVDCRGASFLFNQEVGNVCYYFDEDCKRILNVTPTPTPTPTTTITPTITQTQTQTPTHSQTPTESTTTTPTVTTTPTTTPTTTSTPTNTVTSSQTPTNTLTPTQTPTKTSTPTPTSTLVNRCSQRNYLIVKAATNTGLNYTALSGIYRNGIMTGFRQQLSIDGFALAVGDLVLVKNNYSPSRWSGSDIYVVQSSGSQFAPWILASYNPSQGGAFCTTFKDNIGAGTQDYCPVYVINGETNAKTEWLLPSNFDSVPPTASALRCSDDTIIRQVRLATTTNISLQGLPIVDGIQTVSGDRILVKDQSNPVENGIYLINGSEESWTRSTDLRDNANFITELRVYVTQGSSNKDTIWSLS
jgi:hypothetical protein